MRGKYAHMTSLNRTSTSVNPSSLPLTPSLGFSRQRRSGLDRFFLIGFIFLLLFGIFFFFFGSLEEGGEEGWQITSQDQKRKPFAVILFLPSWEDVIECEMGFTSIQSLVESGVWRFADILILTIENETSTTISPQNRFREDLFRLGVNEIIEVKMPVNTLKDIDFAKLRVWELEQYHKVAVMNVNTFVHNSIEDLFLNNDFVSSPSGFSPLDCGFFALKPSRSVYQEMLEIISNSSLFSSEIGWKNNTRVGFEDVTTCQGFLHYFLHSRTQTQQQMPQAQAQHILNRSLVARTLPSSYICNCSCQMSDTSLKEQQGKVRLFQFGGLCNPFPLPVRVRKQQRLRAKFLLLREAHLVWEETHDKALTRLGGPVYLVNKGIGTHPLVAHLDLTTEQQEEEGEEMET